MRESQKCAVRKTTADRNSTGTKQSKAKKKSSNADSTWEGILSGHFNNTALCTLPRCIKRLQTAVCCALVSPQPLPLPLPVPRRAMCSLWAPRSPPRWASSLSRSWGSSWERNCRSCWNRCKRRSRRTGRFCRWLSNPCYCLFFFFYMHFDHCRKKNLRSASGPKRYKAAAEKWNIPLELFR